MALDRENDIFAWWDRQGNLEGNCSLVTMGFSSLQANAFTEYQGSVFVATIQRSPDEGKGVGYRGYIVDLKECKVKRTVSFPGPVMQVARTRDAWVAKALPMSFEDSEDRWPGCDVFLLSDEGRIEEQLKPPEGLIDRWRENGVHHEMATGCTFGRLALTGKTHWVIPVERYEFWRPRQRGLPEFLLSVPECLASSKKELTGKDAKIESLKRMDNASEETQELLWESLDRGSLHVQLPAVSAAATRDDLLAVTVRVHGESGRSCRLDLWDMALEAVVFSTSLGDAECNRFGFLALGDGVVWTLDENKTVIAVDLPDVLVPIENLCDETGSAPLN